MAEENLAAILALALHMAAGILIAVVGVKRVPRTLTVKPAWAVILALFAGGVFFMLLSFTSGILLTVTVEKLVPEAHKEIEPRLGALLFVGGFSLFALLSVYLKIFK